MLGSEGWVWSESGRRGLSFGHSRTDERAETATVSQMAPARRRRVRGATFARVPNCANMSISVPMLKRIDAPAAGCSDTGSRPAPEDSPPRPTGAGRDGRRSANRRRLRRSRGRAGSRGRAEVAHAAPRSARHRPSRSLAELSCHHRSQEPRAYRHPPSGRLQDRRACTPSRAPD